jgi:outer membrane protein TolC
MRWKIVVAGLALVFGISLGCKQQCFMTTDDLEHYKQIGEASLEFTAGAAVTPAVSHVPPPATVFDSERKIRYITLAEVIAVALEQGTTGVQSPFFPGAINDLLVTFSGQGISGADNIRVLALQPAIIGSNIESALSKFDTRFIGNVTWSAQDQPVANALQTIQSAVSAGTPVIATDAATVSGTLLKPLPTGGVAGITFNTNYNLTNLRQRVNPNYQPNLVFSFEQPLLQGFGVEINQIRASHPGSILNPYPNVARTEGILITRIRFDESRAEFERNLNFMLVNVEIAYWNLYGSYWTLYSNEAALRQAYEAWKINKVRFEIGRSAIQDVAQSRQQYELFRGQRLAALGDCLEKERQLRGFLALPVEDGYRLVPSDAPILAPYNPDWQTAVNEALAKRPELILARNEVKFRQLDLINQKNLLMPDLRFVSQYGWTGIGSRLDGPLSANDLGAGNAFRSLATFDFTNWTIGLQTTIPLGFRDANAAVRAARLNLAQSHQVLLDQERKAVQYLTFQYRQLFQAYEQIRIQRAQREAAAIQLDARFRLYIAGSKDSTLDILLEAQRVWSSALQAEYANIVTYNNALASFEFAKGTIMEHNNVVISEGPLPVCAQVRAVEHERQRAKAIVLRERPTENVAPPGSIEAGDWKIPGVPYNNDNPALPNLPDLLQAPPDLEMSPKPRNLPTGAGPMTQATPATGTPGQPMATMPAQKMPAVMTSRTGQPMYGTQMMPVQATSMSSKPTSLPPMPTGTQP